MEGHAGDTNTQTASKTLMHPEDAHETPQHPLKSHKTEQRAVVLFPNVTFSLGKNLFFWLNSYKQQICKSRFLLGGLPTIWSQCPAPWVSGSRRLLTAPVSMETPAIWLENSGFES